MEWITVVLDTCLTLLTGFYVFITYRILTQMNTPRVSVFLDTKKVDQHYVMYLCVSNDGTGTAHNIAFNGESNIEQLGQVNIIQNGIPILRQNQIKRSQIKKWERRMDIEMSSSADKFSEPKVIRITYQDFRYKKYDREITLHFHKAYDFETTDA